MSMGPEHLRALRHETMVSTAINCLVPTAIIWAIGASPPQTLFGPRPIVLPMLGAAGLATFVMTLVLTLIVRARVRSGALRALVRDPREMGLWRLVPRALPLRAVALALFALLLMVPAGLCVVALVHILPLGPRSHIAFNLVFGALVGIVMTRFVVIPALADRPRG